MPRNKLRALPLVLGLLAGAAAAQGGPAPGGDEAPALAPAEVYRREVFRYARGGRPDPFQPLLNAGDLGYRLEDVRLTGIVYSPNPRQSVAVFALADSSARFRLRAGQRLGSITVLSIYPRRVDVRVDDFGVGRIESIQLARPGPGPTRVGPAPDPSTGQATLPIQVAPAAEPPPSGPLRRGGRAPAAGQPSPAGRGAGTRGTTTTRTQPRDGGVLSRPRP